MPNIRKKTVRHILTLLHLIPTEARPANFTKMMRKLHKKIGSKAAADYPSSRARTSTPRNPSSPRSRKRPAGRSKASGRKGAVGTRAPRRVPAAT